MSQTVEQALQDATIYTDDYLYCLVKLPINGVTAAAGVIAEAGNPFSALLLDKDEITLVLEEEDFEQFKKRLLGHEVSAIRYRLITLDVVLDPNLIGFMAHISHALATSQISLLPFAAYSRDHILVSDTDFERALTVLNELKMSVS